MKTRTLDQLTPLIILTGMIIGLGFISSALIVISRDVPGLG